jgi:hypothetical protein
MSALAAFAIETPASLQPVRYVVPVLDNDEFAALKPKVRTQVQLTLRLLERVSAIHARGEGSFVNEVEGLALAYRHIRGLAGSSLLRKYYAFVESGGNWRVLVPAYKTPAAQPKQFQEFLKGLIEQNPRSIATAIGTLRDELWPSGASIPGYGTWQEWFAARYPQQVVPAKFPGLWPEGWTTQNLRRYGPSKAERKLFTQGLGAAHSLMPTITRDTSKLRPLELIAIDDFRLDVRCVFPGDPERGLKPQIAEVAGLLALDVATRRDLAHLLGPLLEVEEKLPDGTVRKVTKNIRAVDVQVLLYKLFKQHGLPEYTVTILCENATASIGAELELMLATVFDGRIRVQRTSLIEHKTLANGYLEHGGTPWEKGWIESLFNGLWNRFATLPGYKGSNERLNGPADTADKLKEASRFLAQGSNKLNLPPEVIEALRLPFPSMATLEQAFAYVLELRAGRTCHKMRGFDTVTEFRWPDPALPAPEGIDPHGPNGFAALALLAPEQQRQMVPVERKESTVERWARLSVAHPRRHLGDAVLATLLLTPKRATWRNHAVTFTHDKVGYSYVDDDNLMAEVAEGTEVLVYVDLAVPESAVICRANGTRIGILRMLGKSPRGVDITDKAALDEARARRAAIVNRVLAGVRARPEHVAANEIMLRAREHNEAVVTTWQTHQQAEGVLPEAAPATAVAVATEQRAAKRLQASRERTAEALQDASELDATTLF